MRWELPLLEVPMTCLVESTSHCNRAERLILYCCISISISFPYLMNGLFQCLPGRHIGLTETLIEIFNAVTRDITSYFSVSCYKILRLTLRTELYPTTEGVYCRIQTSTINLSRYHLKRSDFTKLKASVQLQ